MNNINNIFLCFALQIKFVDEKVAIGKYLEDVDKFQSSSDTNAQVYIVFGLQEQDLDDCHHTDAECTGTTVWDSTFSMKTAAIQNGLKVDLRKAILFKLF